MRFFLSPFVFLFELIGFLLSAAFVYGLVLIASIIFLVYMINGMKSREVVTEYITVVEETTKTETVKVPERVCLRVDGCITNLNAETEEEYCPTCVWK
jgi:hypothetical protein